MRTAPLTRTSGFDLSTGEEREVLVETGALVESIADEANATASQKRQRQLKASRHKKFVMMDLNWLKRADMTNVEWAVFTAIAGSTGRDNEPANVGASTLATRLRRSERAVQNALTALVRRRIVIRVQRGAYLVSPHLAFRGSLTDWSALTAEYEDFAPIISERA